MNMITTNELDRLLTAMLHSAEGISDLLFVAGKPPQVEAHGTLEVLDRNGCFAYKHATPAGGNQGSG